MTETPDRQVQEALDAVRESDRAEQAALLREQLETDQRIVDALARRADAQ